MTFCFLCSHGSAFSAEHVADGNLCTLGLFAACAWSCMGFSRVVVDAVSALMIQATLSSFIYFFYFLSGGMRVKSLLPPEVIFFSMLEERHPFSFCFLSFFFPYLPGATTGCAGGGRGAHPLPSEGRHLGADRQGAPGGPRGPARDGHPAEGGAEGVPPPRKRASGERRDLPCLALPCLAFLTTVIAIPVSAPPAVV